MRFVYYSLGFLTAQAHPEAADSEWTRLRWRVDRQQEIAGLTHNGEILAFFVRHLPSDLATDANLMRRCKFSKFGKAQLTPNWLKENCTELVRCQFRGRDRYWLVPPRLLLDS